MMILIKKRNAILGVIGLLLSACDDSGGDSNNSNNGGTFVTGGGNTVGDSNNVDNGGLIVDGDDNTVVVEAADNGPQNRNLIEELQSRVDGFLILVPYINGVQPINDQGEGFQWIVQNFQDIETIDFSGIDAYLTAPSNEVSLQMMFVQPQGWIDEIANTSVGGVRSSNSGGTITSEDLLWFYDDQDQDGLFTVEELDALPADCDGDTWPPHNDPDSDNDGILDGLDSTPNGPPCVN